MGKILRPKQRKSLTNRQKVEKLKDQNYVCANLHCSTGVLDSASCHFDHILPLWSDGDNSTQNYQALCHHCHAVKTKKESAERAKWIRQIKRYNSITKEVPKKKINNRPHESRGAPKIKSRGFSKTHRRKMDGTIEKRTK
jgi:5-methylcytosine-specific restriction endonuclease McrA